MLIPKKNRPIGLFTLLLIIRWGLLFWFPGKVLAGIHVTPEAAKGGMIGRLRDGDLVTVDASQDLLQVELDEAELKQRTPIELADEPPTLGRHLFAKARAAVSDADAGADFIF